MSTLRDMTRSLISSPYRAFTTLDLVERKEHCSYLYQEVVHSLEQVELMGLVRRCFTMDQEVQRVTRVD